MIALVFYLEYKFKITMMTGQSESFTLRIGYTTVHPKLATSSYRATRLQNPFVIGPKKSLDGKVQWKPSSMQVIDQNAVREEDVKFILEGIATPQETLSVQEKEVIVKEVDRSREEKLERELQLTQAEKSKIRDEEEKRNEARMKEINEQREEMKKMQDEIRRLE